MKTDRKMISFFIVYFIYFFTQALSYCLLMKYLTDIGYTASERSLFFVCTALYSMAAQVIVGYLCDKYKKIKPYLYMVFIVYIITVFFLYRMPERNFPVHLILVSIVGGDLYVTNGLMDSLVLESGQKYKDNFGAIRAFGSIGWAIGSPVLAVLVERFGYESIGLFFAACCLLTYLAGLKISDAQKPSSEPVSGKDLKMLITNRNYIYAVTILFFAFIMNLIQNYAVVDKFTWLNATTTQLSFYWTLMAVVELPLFFVGGRLMKKFGPMKLLVIALIAFILKFFLFGFVKSVNGMLAACTLQMCTFPIIMLVSKILVDDNTPENLRTSGQQVGLSIYSGGGNIISPLLSGLLEDSIGVNNALYAVAALGLVPLVLTIINIRKRADA